MIDVRDNNYTDRSPCSTCPRHLQGLDKNKCIDTCKRLDAYRNGQSWENEDVIKIDDKISSKQTKQAVKSSDTLQKIKKKGGIMPEVEKTSVKTCIISGCNKKIYVRDLCSSCYQSWRKGYILHPVIGEYVSAQAKSHFKKSKVVAVKKVYIEPSIPNRDKVFKFYMMKYPEIMQYIVETAQKSLLPAKDIFMQLVSEAIIARKRKGDKS